MSNIEKGRNFGDNFVHNDRTQYPGQNYKLEKDQRLVTRDYYIYIIILINNFIHKLID